VINYDHIYIYSISVRTHIHTGGCYFKIKSILKQVSSYKGVWSNCGIGIVPDSGPYITNLKYHLQLVFCQTSRKKHLNL